MRLVQIRPMLNLFLLLTASLHAQYPGWTNYGCSIAHGNIVEHTTNYFWIATNGGLVRFEQGTGNSTHRYVRYHNSRS